MSDSANPTIWLGYATENLQVARASLESGWLNACLQNAQQAIEKACKAVIISKGYPVRRTHSICDLARETRRLGCDMGLSDDDCELIDAIYLPSKYPPDSAMPLAVPDAAICRQCLEIAGKAIKTAERLLETDAG